MLLLDPCLEAGMGWLNHVAFISQSWRPRRFAQSTEMFRYRSLVTRSHTLRSLPPRGWSTLRTKRKGTLQTPLGMPRYPMLRTSNVSNNPRYSATQISQQVHHCCEALILPAPRESPDHLQQPHGSPPWPPRATTSAG